MSSPGPRRLAGHRLTTPATVDLDIPAGPGFITNPARGCNTGNAHLFFTEGRDSLPQHTQRGQDRRQQNQAINICRTRCPFTTECATFALDHYARDGVWGGYVMSSVEERRRAVVDLGWKPGPKPPTEAELRAQRVAAAQAERARIEAGVRAGWADRKSDSDIGLHLGVSTSHVANVRQRLDLPAHYGPGGRRIDHELASA